MSDARNTQNDRWRELAEMLGLPGDAPPPAPPVKETPPPVAPVQSRSFEEEFTPPVPEAASAIESTVAFEEVFVEDDDVVACEVVGEEAEPTAEGPPETQEQKDEKGRRRRRGRRGRRGRRDDDEATAPKDAAPAEVGKPAIEIEGDMEQVDDEPAPSRGFGDRDDRGQRGQQHRGGRSEDEAAPTAVAEEAGDDDDDFSKDLWADWNVPNWQELIDSLHRPERDHHR